MRQYSRLVFVAVLFAIALPLRAQYLGWDYQEQARTHTTDVQNIEMHISFDQAAKKVMGTVYHTLAILPQRDPVTYIEFDAMNMNIEKVWILDGKKQTPLVFDTEENGKLRMTLDKQHPNNVPFTIGIQYWTKPKKGMYFISADSFYTQRTPEVWTQGEGEDNRYWLPTYDYPNDKATTEMYVTVPANQKALSNGHLVGKAPNKDGTVTWHWKEDKPYSTYLIMLGVGEYEVVTDKWRGKDVDYWVYPGWSKEAHRIFGETPKMLEFYSNSTGYQYAWEKYAQIAIEDFMYGGMENVSATTMNDYILYDKRSGVDFNAEGLIAHELAHQWFGDVVTCRSWIHMWLNESFATYFEAMFRQFNDGQDEFDEEMYGSQLAGIGAETGERGKKPIVAANNYTANHYPRGAATLNMIRHILGDTGWWKSIHHYLDMHQFQPVVTDDLKMAFEETTGQNLQWFFDEWIYKSGHPNFKVDYEYDDAAKVVRMTVTQTQQHDSLTSTFKMPVDVELTMPDGTTRFETLRLSDSSQKFTIVSPQKPVMVIFDKGNTIIKELQINNSAEQWVYQLTHAKAAIERSQAALNMNPKPQLMNDAATNDRNAADETMMVAALKNAALHDQFWAVRLHALTALRKFENGNVSIEDVVVELAQHDPRQEVRAQAIDYFPNHVSTPKALPVLTNAVTNDSSYHVNGSALNALFHYAPDQAFALAHTYLKTGSPRDRIRSSAVGILEQTKNPQALNELIGLIGQHDIPKHTRYDIIEAIAKEVEVDSGLVYRTLWTLADNGDLSIRGVALNRLADLGDEATLRKLEAQAVSRPDMKVTYDSLLKRMCKRLNIAEPSDSNPPDKK